MHADRIHAVFDLRIQRTRQRVRIHIVLILAHADGLGFDLHQLRQRILQAPRDGHRAAQADIKVRKFVRRQF